MNSSGLNKDGERLTCCGREQMCGTASPPFKMPHRTSPAFCPSELIHSPQQADRGAGSSWKAGTRRACWRTQSPLTVWSFFWFMQQFGLSTFPPQHPPSYRDDQHSHKNVCKEFPQKLKNLHYECPVESSSDTYSSINSISRYPVPSHLPLHGSKASASTTSSRLVNVD